MIKRKLEGETYYFVNDEFVVSSTSDLRYRQDNINYASGNYFNTREDAEMCATAILEAIRQCGDVISGEGSKTSYDLTLNQYQSRAMDTCMPSCANFSYMFLNLVGEVGELASKVAKSIRKEQSMVYDSHLVALKDGERTMYDKESDEALKLEAGDILWQLAGLCKVMGWSFNEIAEMNLNKLASRQKRGVIEGNGDFR